MRSNPAGAFIMLTDLTIFNTNILVKYCKTRKNSKRVTVFIYHVLLSILIPNHLNTPNFKIREAVKYEKELLKISIRGSRQI